MISGRVAANAYGLLEPWVTVSINHASGGFRQYDVIVDTGFTGWLMLPEYAVAELGLTSEGIQQFILATGAVGQADYYFAHMTWHGQPRRIEVMSSINQALLGMELLRDNWITVRAWDGGEVIIEEATPAL